MDSTGPDRVLVACFAKSGSTYVARVLSRFLDAPMRDALSYWGHREQNLDRPFFSGADDLSYVLQMHVKPYSIHLDLLGEFGVRVVWLRRNLGDVVVSLDDHIARESHRSPVGYVHDPSRYLAMGRERRYDYLIRHAIPWYISFHLMWRDAAPAIGAVPARYEEMVEEPIGFFGRILEALGHEAQPDRLRSIMDGVLPAARFNRGVIGRSSAQFSEGNKARLEEALGDHPEDLSDLLGELPWLRVNATPSRAMPIAS